MMLKLKVVSKVSIYSLILWIVLFGYTNMAKADCAKDLYSCGKAAGTLGYEVLENSADMLAYIIAGGPCITAMSAGDPTTVGFTGLIMGLGASGVVRPHNTDCEADIYGVAGKPLAAIIDKVIPGKDYSGQINGASTEAIKALLSGVPVPSAIPTVSGQVYCGCHLLGTGAKAIDNAREVAQAADAAYRKCDKATNSCPGLKQALAAGKWAVTAVGDAVEFVDKTACEITDGDGPAVSPQHMYQTHFEYMLNSQLEQDLADIPMAGSNHQNQFNAEMGFCNRHYDNRCKDGAKICNAIAVQTYNPAYYALLIEQLNGKLFNKYFFSHSAKISTTSGCPAPGGISLTGNDGGAIAVMNSISKHCTEEVSAIIEGKNGGTSYIELARAGLPANIDGWLKKNTTGKWVTDSQKVYDQAIAMAAISLNPLVTAVQDKYKEEYKTVASQGELAAAPYDYFDGKYRGWTFFKMAEGLNKCPPGLVNFNGHEKQCVEEVVGAFGYQYKVAVTKGEFMSKEQIAGAELKGSAIYDIARAEFVRVLQQSGVPVIRIKDETQEQKYERLLEKAKAGWIKAEPAAMQAANNIIPQIIAQAGERQFDVRTAQESSFIDLQSNLKGKYDEYTKKCKSKTCSDAMYQKWVTLVDKINAARAALQQATKPNKAFEAIKFQAVIAQYQQEIKDIEPQFKAIVSALTNVGAMTNQIKSAGVKNTEDKLANGKKLETLDKSGLRGNGDSTLSLQDQVRDGRAGSALGKPLPGVTDQDNAKPTTRGMRAAPGMVAMTPSSVPKAPVPQRRLPEPATAASLEDSQNSFRNRVESQPINDKKPPQLGAGFDLANKPVSGAVEMSKPADSIGSGNVANVRDIASKPAANIGASVAADVATRSGRDNQRGTSSSPPATSTPPPIKNITGTELASATKVPEPSFDRQLYQRVKRQNLESKWLAQCKNETCKNDISGLITSRINEVLQILDSGTDLRIRSVLDATEVRMDIKYNPLMQAKVDAAKVPPFDRQLYQHVKRQNLESKWLVQCKNETCKNDISGLVTSRINEVLQILDSGTDLRIKSVLDATEVRMDIKYNPLMQAKVDASTKIIQQESFVPPVEPVKPIGNTPKIKSMNF